jgi:PBP1b-binding outer membrane lipoprotein LpoB
MRKMAAVILITIAMAIGGCSKAKQGVFKYNQGAADSLAQLAPPRSEAAKSGVPQSKSEPAMQKVSLDSAGAAQASAQITERKIIRNAEMTIEISDPNEGLQKIASIAEKNGGFVVTSESRENQANAQNLTSTTVAVVARVPAAQFDQAVEAIRRIGGRMKVEKLSGMDVTEEYIDLEARIRTKRALEMQFLEIMRQARKISDALEVQNQLADVRTEIESLEGRRRFLENKSALSTISVTLQTPAPMLAATTSGFMHSVKLAFGDGLDAASEIVLGIIRFVMVMIPIALFILLPCWLLYKWLRRYISWPKRTAPLLGITDQAD